MGWMVTGWRRGSQKHRAYSSELETPNLILPDPSKDVQRGDPSCMTKVRKPYLTVHRAPEQEDAGWGL